jgi:predicted PurR-regulated permease PerM
VRIEREVHGKTRVSRGVDWQRALYIPLTILAWLAVIVAGFWILSHFAKTIMTVILAAIIAFALTPVVSLLSRYMRLPLAIGASYILGLTLVLGMLALVIVTAAEQVKAEVSTADDGVSQESAAS